MVILGRLTLLSLLVSTRVVACASVGRRGGAAVPSLVCRVSAASYSSSSSQQQQQQQQHRGTMSEPAADFVEEQVPPYPARHTATVLASYLGVECVRVFACVSVCVSDASSPSCAVRSRAARRVRCSGAWSNSRHCVAVCARARTSSSRHFTAISTRYYSCPLPSVPFIDSLIASSMRPKFA